jgi:hypothetical protein
MVQFVGAKTVQLELHVSVIQSQFIATALRIETGTLFFPRVEVPIPITLFYCIYLQLFKSFCIINTALVYFREADCILFKFF